VSELSQAGVDHLKNMKRLHTLQFYGAPFRSVRITQRTPDFIISVAGEVPSLCFFTFSACGRNQNDVLEKFAEKYSSKELLIDDIKYVPVYFNIIINN
jgi:hypothetical protein